jgi:hypothetical protein
MLSRTSDVITEAGMILGKSHFNNVTFNFEKQSKVLSKIQDLAKVFVSY